MNRTIVVSAILTFILFMLFGRSFADVPATKYISSEQRQKIIDTLVSKHGVPSRSRLNICIPQVANTWKQEDGSIEDFTEFCVKNFISDPKALSNFLSNMEDLLETTDKSFNQIDIKSSEALKMAYSTGSGIKPYDALYFLYDPRAHFYDDMYESKVAFAVLLNFPLLSNEDMSRTNYFWMRDVSRDDWAAFRLAKMLDTRVPASLYDKQRKLRLSVKVPADSSFSYEKEDGAFCFYNYFRRSFDIELAEDVFCSKTSTYLDRFFNDRLEMNEHKVEDMLIAVLKSKKAYKVSEFLQNKLNRPLKPSDVSNIVFDDMSDIPLEKLDRITREKYTNADDLQRDLSRILLRLGFSKTKSDFLVEHIVIQDTEAQSCSSTPVKARGDKVFLRVPFKTVNEDGLSYVNYTLFMSELGRSVSNLFSVYGADRYLLSGLPNAAFSQGFAYIFSSYALDALGIKSDNVLEGEFSEHNRFWTTWRSSGEALHALQLYRWMYAHPDASATEISLSSENIAKEIWNTYYAPVIGVNDSSVLSAYLTTYKSGLDVINYPIGNIIAAQLADYINDKNMALEMERMCSIGRLTPDVWMQKATGSSLSVNSLLK